MTDFDTVLERLVSDPSFAAALAADPGRALAGYQLSADELALLHSQVGGDTGGQTAVETRATQSSVFGLLSPLAGLGGGLAEAVGLGQPAGTGVGQAAGTGLGQAAGTGPGQPAGTGFGPAPAGGSGGAGPVGPIGGGGSGPAGAGIGQTVGAGWGGSAGFGEPAYAEDFGPATGRGSSGLGAARASGGALGAAGSSGLGAAGAGAGSFGAGAREAGGGITGLGDSIGRDLSQAAPAGASASGVSDLPPPEGYRTRVDVNGDGTWDRHTLHGRVDGGVDIHVDLNRDGQVDFVGRDDNADGLVDSAAYDKDHDGFFEKHMYDDDGDGWLDRSVTRHPPG